MPPGGKGLMIALLGGKGSPGPSSEYKDEEKDDLVEDDGDSDAIGKAAMREFLDAVKADDEGLALPALKAVIGAVKD